MKFSSFERAWSPLVFAGVVVSIIHCGGNGPGSSFSSEGDARVMSGIVGTWVGTSNEGRSYTMTLCEDTSSAPHDSELSCETLHTVKGGGRGATETVNEPGGCGGCDYDNSAYVTGSVEGDDLPTTTISGQLGLSGGDTDELAFPYQTQLNDLPSGSPYGTHLQMFGTMVSAGVIDQATLTYPAIAVASDGGDQDAESADAGAAYSVSDAGALARATATGLVFHRVGDAACPSP